MGNKTCLSTCNIGVPAVNVYFCKGSTCKSAASLTLLFDHGCQYKVPFIGKCLLSVLQIASMSGSGSAHLSGGSGLCEGEQQSTCSNGGHIVTQAAEHKSYIPGRWLNGKAVRFSSLPEPFWAGPATASKTVEIAAGT